MTLACGCHRHLYRSHRDRLASHRRRNPEGAAHAWADRAARRRRLLRLVWCPAVSRRIACARWADEGSWRSARFHTRDARRQRHGVSHFSGQRNLPRRGRRRHRHAHALARERAEHRLGPCFIFGWGPFPGMGVTGAAVATNIGRGIGVLYQLWHLAGHHSRVRVRWRHSARIARCREHPAHRRQRCGAIAHQHHELGRLFKILAARSTASPATPSRSIVVFALMPAWGLANAGATLVGQNLGAKNQARRRGVTATSTHAFSAPSGLFHRPRASLAPFHQRAGPYAAGALDVSLAFPLYAAGIA